MSEHAAQPSPKASVAVVTGASSGIGRAVAVTLARAGARVLGVGRDRARLDALAKETGASALSVRLEEPDAAAKVYEAAALLGPALILIHCAGRGGHHDRPIFEQSAADWRATMGVNLDAGFELARLAARAIRTAGWGRIIMVSSTAGEIGAPAMAPYCASKHGVIGLVRSVAHDIAPFGGTANAVLPSWVRTEMAERDAEREAGERGLTAEAVWAERDRANPRGRIVTAAEVAEVVSFLASPAASGVNGQAVTVSAGALW